MLIPDRNNRLSSILRCSISRQAEEIVADAYCRLDQHFMFQVHLKSLNLSFHSGTLRVTGQLPSFYYKQVLQTALQDVDGVSQVDNRISISYFKDLNKAVSSSEDQNVEKLGWL